MSKRKRDDLDVNDRESYKNTKRIRHSLLQQISHGETEICKALKVARGFERQKLGRRQKDATKSKDEKLNAKLNEEVSILKTFDLAKLATAHLHKTLLRIPSIAKSELFPSAIITIERVKEWQISDPTGQTVSSRLFRSAPVKKALDEAIESLRGIIGTSDPINGTESPVVLTESPPKQSEPSFSLNQEERSDYARAVNGDRGPQDEFSGSEDEDGDGDDPGNLGSLQDSDSDDKTAYDADEMDEGSEFEGLDDLVGNEDEEDDEGEDDLNGHIKPDMDSKEPARQTKPIKATTSTTFLPSLQQGYISGSGSEAGDDIDEPAPRKNRRGQRARQQIWEKKYRDSANHIRKHTKQDPKWDNRKGAVDEKSSGKRGDRARGRPQKIGRGPEQSGANSEPVAPRKIQPQGGASVAEKTNAPKAIHPSWEAAKKRKEAGGMPAFAGKKMTFS